MTGVAERVQVSKASVAYQASNDPARSCKTCVMFHPDSGTCDLVAGQIAPGAVCNKWEALMPLADAAAEAFLSGWAISGGPFTERVHAGLSAAVAAACEHADHPDVLTEVMKLGELDGIWATVYQRRAKLQARHERAVLAAWRQLVKSLDPGDVVRVFRREAYLTAEAATKDPKKRWWQELGAAAALGWLRSLYQHDGYDGLVSALADAIRAGMAEGEAGALAVAASQQGKTGFRLEQAFKTAYDRLATNHDITRQAADAATRLIDATAGNVGRRLAKLAGDDASSDDMAAGVQDVTSTQSPQIQAQIGDTLWTAIGAGIVGLYALASAQRSSDTGAEPGAEPGEEPEEEPADIPDIPAGPDTPPGGPGDIIMIAWVTDGNPCPTCIDNEANGPYMPQDVPAFPAHPRCKCDLTTADWIPSSFFAAYLLS